MYMVGYKEYKVEMNEKKNKLLITQVMHSIFTFYIYKFV